MILSSGISGQNIEIWAPRWHDRVVLIAKHKVGQHNIIRFTKAPTLPGEFYISGRDAHMCDVETNGTIDCYAVPLKFLEPLERREIPRSAKQLSLGV